MTKTHLKWLLVAIVFLAIAAFMIPDSPFYWGKLRKPDPQFEGHTKSYWLDKLNGSDAAERLEAIKIMGKIGPEASEAVPTLTKFMLEDDDRIVRNEAALALSKMHAASAVPALAQALEDKEPIVRLNACNALFRLGKEALPALPALIKALKDKDNDTNAKTFTFTIQEMAARSIGRATAGTAEGVSVLMEALSSATAPDMRRSLALALGEIGPEARAAIPQLRKLIKDKDRSEVITEAELALKAIGVDPKEDPNEKKQVDVPPK